MIETQNQPLPNRDVLYLSGSFCLVIGRSYSQSHPMNRNKKEKNG
jgi:hypothetical protein